MGVLNERQLELMKEIIKDYLAAPPDKDGFAPAESGRIRDEGCKKIIEEKLDPLITDYLYGDIPLSNL